MAVIRKLPRQIAWHRRLLASHIGFSIFIQQDINRLSEAAEFPCPPMDRHPQLLASLNRALIDAHWESIVEQTKNQPAPGNLVESFNDVAQKAHQLLMALGV